jgi:uncharacterized protein
MRLMTLLLVLFVCPAGPAVAGSYEDAVTAHGKGDYATALRLWRTLADSGLRLVAAAVFRLLCSAEG